MDMAIPEEDRTRGEGFCPPLLKVRYVGKIGFWSVANRLTSLDLGRRFSNEWERRLVRLREEWTITGRFPYS